MRNIIFSKFFFMPVIFLFFTTSFAENPIIQTNYTADPAPMVYKDTVFLYTGHDEDNAQSFVMNNWMLYTTTDLVNWTDRGIIASLNSFSWQAGSAWAAQCVERNGKFYLYCPLNYNVNGRISIGVLTSNSPYGPFTDPLGKPLITGTSGANDYDPTVFVDDDGQAYIYWGGNGPCMWAKLDTDMTSLSGSIQTASIDLTGAPSEASYTEGPWLFKRYDKYYLAWASRCCPEGIGYAMSSSPAGPWTCKGLVMAPNDTSSGNHPGIINYLGKWYVFGFDYELLYSRIAYSTSKPERRSICVKEMTYNAADSTITRVPWWGHGAPLPSVTQVRNLNPYDTTQAETICWSYGVRTETCNDSGAGMDVDSIHNGDYIKVAGADFGSGSASKFIARVASATSGGNIEIHIDSLKGTIIGTCAVTGTNGWQMWTTVTCNITGSATGVHNLFFKFTGNSGMLFNFNWWKFNTSVGVKNTYGVKNISGNTACLSMNNQTQTLRIDFNSSVLHNKVGIRIFDLTGRQAADFSYVLTSEHLAIPLHNNYMRPGVYLVNISLNGAAALTKAIIMK